jgi:hypothetical protein
MHEKSVVSIQAISFQSFDYYLFNHTARAIHSYGKEFRLPP